uniref:Uncharacterized protein n=1 Tax=Cacopsylla melanoneura TaxID=428564 RepID=A0A8D8VKE0_9HEMI
MILSAAFSTDSVIFSSLSASSGFGLVFFSGGSAEALSSLASTSSLLFVAAVLLALSVSLCAEVRVESGSTASLVFVSDSPSDVMTESFVMSSVWLLPIEPSSKLFSEASDCIEEVSSGSEPGIVVLVAVAVLLLLFWVGGSRFDSSEQASIVVGLVPLVTCVPFDVLPLLLGILSSSSGFSSAAT